MKSMISELVVNEEVTSYFLVSEFPQVRKNKKDKDYLCLKIQDKTGNMEARVWDIPPNLDPKSLVAGSIIKVQGQVSKWNKEVQLTIKQIRLINEADQTDIVDFFERSERDPEEMFDELYAILESLEYGQVKNLLFKILYENKDNLLKAPAAKSVHHNYVGGLLEHVLSLCKTAIVVSQRYDLRLDLMLATCLLHDIGKVVELTYPIIGYSTQGTLLGHISIGMMMVAKAIDEVENFDPKLKMTILHLMASHHGTLAWGSPRVPLMKEAIAFHLIDSLDAKLAICDKAIKKGISAEGMTEWVKELEGPLFFFKED